MDDKIAKFIACTGASHIVARECIELASEDVDRAVVIYFEHPEYISTADTSGGRLFLPSRDSMPPVIRDAAETQQSPRDVIQISDDDESDNMIQTGYDSAIQPETAAESAEPAKIALLAQEAEDAAMAELLYQEELHKVGNETGSVAVDTSVRAPIARTTETLVAPDPTWRDHEAAMGDSFIEQFRQRGLQRHDTTRSRGPFGHAIWSDGSTPPPPTTENGTHARRLEDLFRPPYDLMTRVPWHLARSMGKDNKKWIMVNLQDMNDFNCQALNRDIWKDEAVRNLLFRNFLFLQYDKDYPDSREYITLYFPQQSHENPKSYPHVSIVDPRTGEQVKVWSGRPFPNAQEFHAELSEFLERYSLEANSKNPVAKVSARKAQPIDIERMTEEEMLELALRNSLAGNETGKMASQSDDQDPDSLIKTSPQTDLFERQPKVETVEQATMPHPFSRIPSTRHHTEPEGNAEPVTRIQFRHPNGRVIRRFRLHDPVQRIYEWLKADPLENKTGVEFELKKMPEGLDLITKLSKTIEEIGLRQGTVMIEFLET